MRNLKQRQRRRKPYYSNRDYRGQYESNPGNNGPRYAREERELFQSPRYNSWDDFGEEPADINNHRPERYGENYANEVGAYSERKRYPMDESQQRGNRYPGQRYSGSQGYGNQWFNSDGRSGHGSDFQESHSSVGSGGYSRAGSAETSDWGYDDAWDRVSEDREASRDFDGRTPGMDTRTDRYGSQDRAYRQRASGHHRGKGPKGYKRSDERIREEISDQMSEDGTLDASTIEVKVKDGDVTLTGDVLSRQDKRRAEDIAESILGIGNVENRIRVRTESAATTRLNEIDSTK
jgi:osmotically-inducible protein OsmY